MMHDNETELDSIRRVSTEFLAAYNSADLEAVCALLTDGAVLMPPNEPTVEGVDSVRGRFESFFNGFTFNIRLDARQIDIVGDIGFERGTYTGYALLKGKDIPPRGGYGEYLLLFERQYGTWRIAAFGTAAAKGSPPHVIAGPERLSNLVEESDDPDTSYWRNRWVETLSNTTPTISRFEFGKNSIDPAKTGV